MSKGLRRAGTVRQAAPLALALVLAGIGGPSAEAEELRALGADTVYNAPPVDDAELRALRGGMTVMGVEFEFGAIQTVLVDGTPVARTTFTLADDGSIDRVSEILNSDMAHLFDGGQVPGMDLGSLGDLKGVLVPGDDGASVVLSGIDRNGFTSALLNNAPNRDIGQNFDVRFVIHDFSSLQAQLSAIRDAQRIVGSLQSGPLSSR